MDYRFLTEHDKKSAFQLHNFVHKTLKNPELFLPLIENNKWYFDIKDTYGAFVENDLVGMAAMMHGEDIMTYAEMLGLSWEELGEVFVCVHPNNRKNHVATDLLTMAVEYTQSNKKKYACATTHPENHSIKILEKLGFYRASDSEFLARQKYPRILWQKDFEN